MVICEICKLQTNDPHHEIFVCDRCVTHFHLVLTKRQQTALISILYNMAYILKKKPYTDRDIIMIDDILQLLEREEDTTNE